MFISWFGLNCFKIQSKDVFLITDPYSSKETGLKAPPLKGDIAVLTGSGGASSLVKPVSRSGEEEEVFIISSPGEYEKKGIFVYGIPAGSAKTICRMDIEGINIAYLGELNEVLDEEQLERLNGIDILIIPVGGDGKSCLDAKKAAEVVNQIEPRIVIPSFYKTPNLKLKIEGVDKFCKEMGIKAGEPVEKLKIIKKDLPQEDTQVILLKA